MKPRLLFIAWTFAATLAAFAGDRTNDIPAEHDDPVIASFERELGHEPVPRAPVTRDAIDSDVLYEKINRPLRSPSDPDKPRVPPPAAGEAAS